MASRTAMHTDEWNRLTATDKPRVSGVCDHCGIVLSSSSISAVRGFVLCKTCREVEVEIDKLAQEEICLKRELEYARVMNSKTGCLCHLRKVANLREALYVIDEKIGLLLADWSDSLVDDNRGE